MHFSHPRAPVCLLVDNGSLRPDAIRNLRRIAGELSGRLGRPVEPVSLLHADRVSPDELDGVAAEILAPALRRRHAAGVREFLVLPLFFGPSRALTEFVPAQVSRLGSELPGLVVRCANPLVDPQDPDDRRLAGILADNARRVPVRDPVVVLVDHGSPEPRVGVVRNHLARQLAGELGGWARAVVAASMERRAGPEFDFNEPLLERALAAPPAGAGSGEVVVVPLFFSPGRHAGPDGDIVTIGRDAQARLPGLRVQVAPLVGEHPGLVELLAERCQQAGATGERR